MRISGVSFTTRAWQAEGWALRLAEACRRWTGRPDWTWDTPLRTEYARRAALVEIDALVAVWLGIEIEEFLAAYESRFGVLAEPYEDDDVVRREWVEACG